MECSAAECAPGMKMTSEGENSSFLHLLAEILAAAAAAIISLDCSKKSENSHGHLEEEGKCRKDGKWEEMIL